MGGVPQTTQLGRRGRRMVSRLAASGEPFLLNLFYSTTHPPFASEYPYYVRHAKADYKGESKFAMARLTEPFEIIRRQYPDVLGKILGGDLRPERVRRRGGSDGGRGGSGGRRCFGGGLAGAERDEQQAGAAAGDQPG